MKNSSSGIYGLSDLSNLVIINCKQGFQPFFNRKRIRDVNKFKIHKHISRKDRSGEETFCSGLFLSARWFAVSQLDHDGIQMIVLPDKDSAEYCAADLYNLIEGDKVFFLPDSGKNLERSNYKSTLGVQRTSAIGRIIDYRKASS